MVALMRRFVIVPSAERFWGEAAKAPLSRKVKARARARVTVARIRRFMGYLLK